jgi:CRP-like cAMP-binding protein
VRSAEPVAMKILNQLSARVRFLMKSVSKDTFVGVKGEAAYDPASDLFKTLEFYESKQLFDFAFHAASQYLKNYPNGVQKAEVAEKIEIFTKTVQSEPPDFNENDWTRTYQKNSMIFAQGEAGGELFVITKGEVKLTILQDGREVFLSQLKAGDVFGEMSFLENKAHTSNAVALEETELMIVDKNNFGRVNKQNPQIATKLATLLSGHIWFWQKQLTNHKLKDQIARVYDMVCVLMERQKAPVGKKSFHMNLSAEELFNIVGVEEAERRAIWMSIKRDGFIDEHQGGTLIVQDVEILVRRTEQLWKIHRFSN